MIAARGVFNADRVTFDGNSAAASGGALYVGVTATANVHRSLFTGNSAPAGAVGTGNNSITNIANSTFADNGTYDFYMFGATLNLSQNTFSGRGRTLNDGVLNASGNAILGGCLLGSAVPATGSANLGVGCPGSVGDAGSEFLPLGSYGGISQARAFSSPSLADQGDSSCTYLSTGTNGLFTAGAAITVDHRGSPRGSTCDIGSFESGSYSGSATLPDGAVGSAYAAGPFSLAGGAAPYGAATTVFSTEPPGITLSSAADGTLSFSGTPAASGNYAFTTRVIDANGFHHFRTWTMAVAGPPGAPGLVASSSPALGELSMTWSAAAANGSPVTGYRIVCDGGAYATALTLSNPIVIGGLPTGVSHTCVVRATNAIGEGPDSPAATLDEPPPVVSSVSRLGGAVTNASSVEFQVQFSRAVTGVDATEFVLTTTGVAGASVTSVTGAGSTYTVTVATGTGSGTIRLDLLDDDSIRDATLGVLGGPGAGNGNFTTGEVYTLDRDAPVVTSVNRVGTAAVLAGTTQSFTVTLSRAVTGVDLGDFTLTVTGTAAATLAGVSGAGSTYTVSVNITAAGPSGGTVRLDVVDDDSIVDALGNRLGGTGAGNGNFTGGQAYTVAAANRTFTGPSPTGSGDITAVFTGGGAACSFTVSQFIPVEGHAASPPAAPANIAFPHGLFDFRTGSCTPVPGAEITMTIVYPSALPPGTLYWKYGPTPTNPTPHWYVMPGTISGNTVTFTITDGGLGDDDLTANGIIVDQGGPGAGAGGAHQTPTMSEWMLALMASLILLLGLRRRRAGP